MDIHDDPQTPREGATIREIGIVGQPEPTPNDSTPIYEMVIADVKRRAEQGRKKYGVALQAFNGRNALQDAYEEVLDLAHYIKQEMVERDTAQAGEARAVEALKEIDKEDRIWHDDDCAWAGIENKCTCGYRKVAQQIALILADYPPALAWLAQREAEAARDVKVSLLEFMANRFEQKIPFQLTLAYAVTQLRAEAAALRAGATGGSDA